MAAKRTGRPGRARARPAVPTPAAAAASAAKRAPRSWLAVRKIAPLAPKAASSGKGSPSRARSGQLRPGGARNRGSCDSLTTVAARVAVCGPPRMLRAWATRKKTAPIRAASTCPTVRVRLGPISRNRLAASSRPAPLAASATQNRTGMAASQLGCPITAMGSRIGVRIMPKMPKAPTAIDRKRTVSALRGGSGEENSRSRSPRS